MSMSRKILVIEDDRDIARLLELHLKDEGYAVSVVSDGKAGLRHALSKPCDLVIFGPILPGMDGLDVCRGIRNRKDYIPVLLRRELVTHVSHDLRTLLTSLQGYLETLSIKEGGFSPEERTEYLRTALGHCRRLSTLVSELFELSTLDAPVVVIRWERLSLGVLAQDILQKFRLEVEEKRVVLSMRIEENLPFVLGDIGRIEGVLQNLLDNALRHTPEGGTIAIAANCSDSGVTIRISDTGCGIPPERLSRLIDPSEGCYGRFATMEVTGRAKRDLPR